MAGAGADGLRYQDYTHHTPSSHVGEQPSVVSGQTQFGGQNFGGTHASMHWGVKDIPTPKEMVGALDDWVVGQPAAKRVSFLVNCWAVSGCNDSSSRCCRHSGTREAAAVGNCLTDVAGRHWQQLACTLSHI
jgi:hypothetical protein